MLAVFAAFPFERGHLRRTLGTGALALIAAVALTVVYHLGYRDFRGSKIIAPMRGAARRDLMVGDRPCDGVISVAGGIQSASVNVVYGGWRQAADAVLRHHVRRRRQRPSGSGRRWSP